MWTGMASTTGIVFSGDDSGHLIAVDVRSGPPPRDLNLGERLTASLIVYEVDGLRQVAIASASAVVAAGLFRPAVGLDSPEITIRK